MKSIRLLAALVAVAVSSGTTMPLRAQTTGVQAPGAQNPDAIQMLLRRVEQVVQAGNAKAYISLLSDAADPARAREFAMGELTAGASRAIIQERDREPLRGTLPGDGFRLMVDVFTEFGDRARVATWRLDVKHTGGTGDREWAILDAERISSLENLYRLSLNGS